MLVYANHLIFHGSGAHEAIFTAVGVWLKEQLGYGLQPSQLKKDGTHEGTRGVQHSWSGLQIRTAAQDEPEFYSWVLTTHDEIINGRQWITELGLKIFQNTLDFSCVLKVDEKSTLVAENAGIAMVSQPRVIHYAVDNIRGTDDADFAPTVVGRAVKNIGKDEDSYRDLQVEIERSDRDSPIILIRPTRDGYYLIDAKPLQSTLFGLAQVVRVQPEFNSYEMADVLGRAWSDRDGAVNILDVPTRTTGFVSEKIFRADDIEEWGNQKARISHLFALVTHNTNISRLRHHIRPESVARIAQRCRHQTALTKNQEALKKINQIAVDQLRQELKERTEQFADCETLLEDAAKLENEKPHLKDKVKNLENEALFEDSAKVEDEKSDLEDKVKNLENEKSDLEDKVKDFENEKSDLEDKVKNFENEKSDLEDKVKNFENEKSDLEDKVKNFENEVKEKNYENKALKNRLAQKSDGNFSEHDRESLLKIIRRQNSLSPTDCIEATEISYGNACVILDSARKSASDMKNFAEGKKLLELLTLLFTDYHTALSDGKGDTEASNIFGKNNFAANESEHVRKNKKLRETRTFQYLGKPTAMFHHLKIGAADDRSKTIRVHFHWDSDRKKIVIGYCGEHLTCRT